MEIANQAAHIYTFSLRKNSKSGQDGYNSFWGMLRYFWSSERVRRWEEVILGPQNTETCENLTYLSPSLHTYWSLAHFALQPIYLSDDRKVLELRFFLAKVIQASAEN